MTRSSLTQLCLLGAIAGTSIGLLIQQHSAPAGERPIRRRLTQTKALQPPQGEQYSKDKIVRNLDRGTALLAIAALTDSAIEHYRGSFRNRIMYLPLGVGGLAVCASTTALLGRPAHPIDRRVYQSAMLTGLAGLGFHSFNILKRPGRLSWHNLFYAAPIGAPAALVLAGATGLAADRLRQAGYNAQIDKYRTDKLVTAIAVLGLTGVAAEVALLHFRGAFQNRAMYVPVTLTPLAAASLAAAAATHEQGFRRSAAWLLRATGVTGLVGVLFHAIGIGRSMGGWRNWRQNVLSGPPLSAPPSLTGLAYIGLAALSLMKGRHRG